MSELLSSVDNSQLDGAVVVVTGGGSGIGAALVARLCSAGSAVTVADIDEDSAHRVGDEFGCDALRLDVGDAVAWQQGLSGVVERHGGLDMVCLNAGVGTRPRGTSVDDDPIPWIDSGYRAALSVNVDGVVFGAMAALPHMEARGGGRIVVTASVAGIRPQPPDPVYGLTKAAVIGFVQSAAPAFMARGVELNALCPGSVDTPLMPDDRRHASTTMSTPAEMAEGICGVLTSGDSGGIWIASSPALPVWRYEFAPCMDGPTHP
jgi:NAD(P)-dependent dehydrogenase (short-subunit alcohol dehydrogenase family)